ncbi:MAG: hypothetical protein RIC04_00435 [Parvibaculum sp.]|uniref:hypothetical protein n=1 Tax=Parvibaculum sp. TaxID=2024848 RepID=UPI0032EB9CDE
MSGLNKLERTPAQVVFSAMEKGETAALEMSATSGIAAARLFKTLIVKTGDEQSRQEVTKVDRKTYPRTARLLPCWSEGTHGRKVQPLQGSLGRHSVSSQSG